MTYQIKQLFKEDTNLLKSLLDCFSVSFEDPDTYESNRSDDGYLRSCLQQPNVIILAALSNGELAGGLVAYELKKVEQKRSEIYIYDLAVYKHHRRNGVATGLIEFLKPIAQARNAWVIYVQADGVDKPAVKLYSGLGVREEVLHFDITID